MEFSSSGSGGGSGFIDPQRIVGYFGLSKGDYVADFGAGHGYFAIPMARIVGGDGRVYAIDIQKATLDVIRSKAKIENLLNIELVWADLEEPDGSHIKSEYVDFVVIANILYQVEKKEAVLREAYRILRKGGRVAIIEWEEIQDRSGLGPPAHLRISKRQLKDLAQRVGFEADREFGAGSHHYGLLFRKPESHQYESEI